MKFILGLDPGVGSIGWAIILEAEKENEKSRLIASGTVKVNFDNFAYINAKGKVSDKGNPVELFTKGNTVSPNLQRRQSRGARRRLYHYKQRRNDLIKLLCENGFINESTILYEEGKATTFETYKLRSKAVSEEISLEELAKVLLMINKKRGYKSGKDNNNEGEENNTSEYLSSIIGRSKILTDKHLTVGQYLMEMLNEHPLKGIKNQIFYRQDYEDEFERIWKKQIQYHPELTRHLKKEIKNRIIFFQRPIESKKNELGFCEFESKQIEVEKGGRIQTVTTGSRVCPVSSPLFQEFRMWQRLNDVLVTNLRLFEKRPLLQEEKEKLAQELSVRKILKKNDVLKLLFGKDRKSYDLNFNELIGNDTQARLVEAYLSIVEQSGHDKCDIKKNNALKIYKNINEVFSALNFRTDVIDGSIVEDGEIYKQPFYQLWHLVYSFPGDNSRTGKESLVRHIKDFFNFNSDEYANRIAEIKFADGYGRLSAKAIQKILPKLKEGYSFSKACELVGYKHSERSRTNIEKDTRPLQKYMDFIPHNSLRNPFVEKILNQMVLLVNSLIDEYSPVYGTFDEIRIEMARELRNGADARAKMFKEMESSRIEKEKCEKELKEKLKEEGYSLTYVSDNDILKYRLYKELEMNGYKTLYSGEYVRLVDLIINRVFDKEHIIPKAKSPSNSFSVLTIERNDINLEKGDLTAFDYMSKKGENALQQYVLTINDLYEKGAFSKAKRDNLLRTSSEIPNEPLNRDLGLTQYISRKAIEMLESITRKVNPTTGSVTKRLREDWQLVNVLQELVWDKYEKMNLIDYFTDKDGKSVSRIKKSVWTKRSDHRNHAMDAITIAFTKPVFIQYLNSLNAQGDERVRLFHLRNKYLHKDDKGNWRFNPPMPLNELRQEVKKQLESILVFHQSSQRLVVPNATITKYKNGEIKKVQLTPRGKLHADTFYGSLKIYDSNSQSIQYIYTKRVVVDENLNVNNVVNERVKEILKKRLEQNNGEAKKAFSNLDENPIWFNEEKGICIKRVVVKATDVKDPIPLHKKRDRKGQIVSNHNNTDFVKPDNNHHAAIYVNAKGELKEDVVTFYDAVRRANRHLPVIDKNAFVKDGWSFLYSIQKNEFFIFPDVESGFNPLEIDLMKQDNFALISPHLYKVQKISSLNYLLRVHTDTSSKTPNELKDITWKSLRSLKGFIGSVKVKINHLGRIYDIEKIQLPG